MATGPAYMNAITSHSKVTTTITLSGPLFVAGQDITGKVELDCKAEREVGIGLIVVELLGVQELNSRDHTAATTFVHSHRIFQGPGLPPSNAVYDRTTPQDPFFPAEYFPGRKGITTFFFKFPTPVSSPSSVSFASDLAKIEYKIRVSIGVAYKGDIRVLTNSVNAELVQCQDMENTLDEHIVVGEGGKMYVRGKLIGGKLITGEKACLELYVKNQTPKKTTGLTLTLTRSLHLHGTGASVPVQLTDTLLSESFRSADYCVSPNTEGIANLVFTVPSSTRVVKGGIREGNVDKNGTRKQIEPLFELRCFLSVKIGMGLGSKDVLFEMPIQVKHRAALVQEATHDHRTYLSPVSPEPIFHRAISPLPSHSPRTLSPMLSPHANSMSPIPNTNQTLALTQSPSPVYAPYEQAPPQPVIHPRVLNPGDPHNARAVSPRLWSPKSLSPVAPYSPQQSPLPGVYYFPPPPPPPPGQLLPFAFPARPNSADPYYYPYYYQNQINLPSGLPSASPYSPFQLPFQNRNRPPLPPVPTLPQPPPFIQTSSQPQLSPSAQVQPTDSPETPSAPSQLQDLPPESAGQPAEGKGERASRIANHLHTPNRARSASPTSHRFRATSLSAVKQPPPSIPLRPYVTSSRHLPVFSPRPVVSPSRTYVGHSPGTIGDGTTKSDRVDLLEQLVDVAPGAEEKSVEEVLRDLEEAERAGRIEADTEPPGFSASSNNAHSKKNRSLLDVFNRDMEEGHNAPTQLNPFNLYNRGNEGLDALERRLLQEVGTRKPEANRPAIFSLGLADMSTSPDPPEQSIATQDKNESRPPSPCTVRLHPRQFRESQISELALGLDNGGFKSPVEQKPPSPAFQQIKQGVDQSASLKQLELKQPQKVVDSRDDAKGRVSAWLNGLPSFSPSTAQVDPAPVTHLAEPKKAPPRKRSIDGVLEFFGIGKNKSREDLQASSPAVSPSPVLPEHADVPKEPLKLNDGLAAPSNLVSPQRRTPSPRRKPVPLYTAPDEEVPSSSSQPDMVTNALPNGLLDPPVPSKSSLKAGQRYGATTNAEETPVTRSSKPFSHPRPSALPRGRVGLPIAPAKPDTFRRDAPRPTPNPLPATKIMPKPLEPLANKSSNASPFSAPAVKLQTKEKVKVKDTLPPIPASAQRKLALPISDIEAKYNVRSARGGRGGVTTSVAAIWASRAEANNKEADSIAPAPAVPRSISGQGPMAPARRLDGEVKANPASTSTTGVAQKASLEHNAQLENLYSSSETPSRHPTKGISVPAQVHEYHAKPQLSSAATLAQPVLDAKYKPPALSMTLSTVFEPSNVNGGHGPASSAVKTGEVHFGQARLKDLIKKYQQGAS